jgi:hypothetical protein
MRYLPVCVQVVEVHAFHYSNRNFKCLDSELLTGEKEGLLQLPTDKVLLTDESFRPFVDKYAAVQTWFLWPFGFLVVSLTSLLLAILFARSETLVVDCVTG